MQKAYLASEVSELADWQQAAESPLPLKEQQEQHRQYQPSSTHRLLMRLWLA